MTVTWFLVGHLIRKQVSLVKTAEENFEANQLVKRDRGPDKEDDGDIGIMNDEYDADADVDVDMSHALKIKAKT